MNDNIIPGIVSGIVSNNCDPEKLGRCKIKFPTMGNIESNWARVATLLSGNNFGCAFLPDINQEVAVSFENGRLDSPYILGSLFNGIDKIPYDNSDSKNSRKIFSTKKGIIIIFDEDENEEKLHIQYGKSLIEITKNDEIIIKAGKNISISAEEKITISAKNIELKASGTIQTQSKETKFNASGVMKLIAKMIHLNP